jgi:class 3 adenylate cyclase/tetratricopeptide (TPR) repeat protein
MNITAEGSMRDVARARLLAYLPRTLLERWAGDPRGEPIWHETISGTLMHCDMSGFTAMSERLAGRGKEGAELMAGVLNRFFERMLRIADGWGGLQMKFGGDAMLLLFEGDRHADRAAACAIDMQKAMVEFKDVEAGGEKHRLRMRAGIHSGQFIAASAGDPDGLLHYLLMGPDVSYTTAVEAAAPLGETALSAAAAAIVRDIARVAPHGDLWRLRGIEPPERPQPRADVSAAPEEMLRRYLMPPVADDDAHLSAEHRRVTAVFINIVGFAELLTSLGTAGAIGQADAYVKLVMSGLDRHGGFLAGSDAAEHGDKLIILFGAPVSSERDEASALRFVLDLRRDVASSGLALRHHIGVSTGFVFAGEIGSSIRREYTVIGDSVNLSARLMAAAPEGAIYVSAATAERAGAEFVLSALKPMSVKGKAAPVRAFRLDGVTTGTAQQPEAQARTLLARDGEMARLLDTARAAHRGAARWAFVFGEPGIGKTAFLDEARRQLAGSGWRALTAYGQSHRSRDVFAAWQTPLRALFGITAEDPEADAWRKIDEGVTRVAPDEQPFAPLIAGLLAVPVDEGPLLRFLDARSRRQRLMTVIRETLRGAARETPILLTFEDAHLCDGPSLELLAEVLDDLDAPVLVCLSSRSTLPPDAFQSREPALRLELHELPADAARVLAAATVALDGDRLDALLARAGGNPLFVQELALSGARETEMPETVNDVIMARLDQLPGPQKSVLRAAAVIGATFEAPHVRTLVRGRVDDAGIERALEGLARSGFTVAAGDAHVFRHPLTQEVIYDTLPFVERRSMHGALAHEIEREAAGHLEPAAGLLLHHFDRASDAPKTVVYAALSGDRAARAYANREAIDYYTRGLTALDQTGNGSESDRSVLLERIGQCLQTQGRHTAATEALADALQRWRGRRSSRRRRLLTLDVPEGVRESVLCRRVAVSYEHSLAYDESLRWLEQALAALPLRGGRITSEIYAAKSATLYRKGEYGDAIAWGKKALAVARRVGEADVIAYAENMIAQSYMAEGSLREAVRHLREAVRLYDEAGDAPGQAAANNNLGSCYQLMGMLDAARRHYEIALAADERVGDIVDIAIIHNNIGEILLLQGATGEAVDHLERVLAAQREHEELTAVAGLSYVNLARCALLTGDVEVAVRHVRHGMRLVRSVGAKSLLTEARMQLAEALSATGDLTGAQREAQRALKDAQAAGERLLEARGERIIGLLRAAAGAIDTAAIHLAISAGLARRIGAGHEEARSLLALARLRIDAGGRPRAAGLRRATAIFERMNAAPDLAEARRLLAKLDAAPQA